MLDKPVLFDANIFMVGISDRVSDKDYTVDNVARELKDLEEVDIITFDIVLLSAYVYYAERNDNSYSKGLKSMYKKHCSDVIKRYGLPVTLGKYIKAVQDYL